MIHSLLPAAQNNDQKILTGIWAIHANDSPTVSSYIEISSTGYVTSYWPNGNPNMPNDWSEHWTVKNDVIETVSREDVSLATSIRNIPDQIFASNDGGSGVIDIVKFRFVPEGDSIIHMELLQSPQHKITLRRFEE